MRTLLKSARNLGSKKFFKSSVNGLPLPEELFKRLSTSRGLVSGPARLGLLLNSVNEEDTFEI